MYDKTLQSLPNMLDMYNSCHTLFILKYTFNFSIAVLLGPKYKNKKMTVFVAPIEAVSSQRSEEI